MKKVLIVVDMQNDFITGALGSAEAQAIVPNVVEKVKEFEGDIYFTRDTHFDDYMNTLEGKKLPVPHCMNGTEGWSIIKELNDYACNRTNEVVSKSIMDKFTFGYKDWRQTFRLDEFESGLTILEIEDTNKTRRRVFPNFVSVLEDVTTNPDYKNVAIYNRLNATQKTYQKKC